MNTREAAYASLNEPLSQADVCRELGVNLDFVAEQIRIGRIKSLEDGRIAGTELARFLVSQRQNPSDL